MALLAAAGVVVADVLGQDRAQVLFAGDEHPVSALGPYRAYETLGVGVHSGLWGPKTCANWVDALYGRRRLGSPVRHVAAKSWPRRTCDDLRLVSLKLIFLIVTRAVSVLGLSRRESWWKDAEILMLRHQLAVAEREHPRAHSRLTWPDRAWLAMLAGTLPIGRLAVMRLIVTPGTILRWHHGIVRRRWAHRSRQGRSGRPTDGPQRAVVGAEAGPGE